jgi:Secretion system C-terminal sorting domain
MKHFNKPLNFLLLLCIMAWSYNSSVAQVANTNISNAVTFDGEPYIVMNPANNQNLVAAWMGLKFLGGSLAIAVTIRSSFDGGNTWSTAVNIPHAGTGYTSADVSLAFDKNGLLYVSYIDYNKTALTGGDFISRSRDGGLTWDTPSQVINISENSTKLPLDRPWLVIDNSNTANFGTLYITTKPAPWISPPNRNYYKVSTDSGHTWSALANVDGGNYLVGNLIPAPMAAPATTSNGNFVAVYPSYVASQNVLPAFYQATSKDKGQTLTYSTVITYAPSALDTNLKGGYKLAADPSDSNKLVFLLVANNNGDADIMALNSVNGGQTWSSTPVRVNDDSLHNGKDQDLVWGDYNEQGKLAVTWRDRRNAPTNGFWNVGYDFYYAISNDNGQTFSANKKMSSQFIAFDSIIAQNGNDFMGCVFSADTLYTVWGDTRTGSMNIFFAKTIASIDSTVGITQLQGNSSQINIYPNPTTTVFNIDVASDMVGKEIAAFDVSGKKIYTGGVQSQHTQLSTLNWASGTYFIKVGNSIKLAEKQ